MWTPIRARCSYRLCGLGALLRGAAPSVPHVGAHQCGAAHSLASERPCARRLRVSALPRGAAHSVARVGANSCGEAHSVACVSVQPVRTPIRARGSFYRLCGYPTAWGGTFCPPNGRPPVRGGTFCRQCWRPFACRFRLSPVWVAGALPRGAAHSVARVGTLLRGAAHSVARVGAHSCGASHSVASVGAHPFGAPSIACVGALPRGAAFCPK